MPLAVRVTLEAAHTKVPLVKELRIDYDGSGNPLCGTVQCMSDPDDRSVCSSCHLIHV